uniref:E4 protein n=1 Tax=Human papillomavirus TaxID=10566 RepID=A0A385PM63_9PAPI|nr:MAG: E4 protein [Human papillomavirus]
MKLCLPLLPVPPLGPHHSSLLLKGEPPRTPFPHRKPLESGNTRPTKTPTGSRPPARAVDFDYDDEGPNKENLPPEQHPLDEEEETVVGYLLKKWAQDLDRYRRKVLQDLEDCRQRLGIPLL